MNHLEIILEHIRKAYAKPVLKDINLHITNDSYITIVGPSGCGKSTLMNILGLIEDRDEGKFLFNGCPIRRRTDYASLRKKNIGFVFQNYNLIPMLTCKENIVLPTMYGKSSFSGRCEELFERLGISDLLQRNVATLSGGEKQRVAFARALIMDPCLLIADEPTGNLDEKNRDAVLDILDQEHDFGRAIVVITHDREVAERGKTVFKLRDGTLHED